MHFKVFSGYYYTRLDQTEKKVYKQMLGSLYNYVGEISFREKLSSTSLSKITKALRLDVPELFYVDFTEYLIETMGFRTKVSFKFLVSPGDAERMKEQIFWNVDDIKNAVSCEADKEKAVHDFLAKNIKYDHSFSTPFIYGIYGALVMRSCVCEGYAKAFKILCDQVGIPCIAVVGESMRENHAWNIVMRGKTCFHVDVTWNSSLYENVDIPVYYNVSDSFMAMDHKWEKSEYPPCDQKGETEKDIIDVVGMESFADSLENMVRIKKETFILRFNRKFSSGDEISSLLQKIVSKRGIRSIKGWGVSYLEKLDCAIVSVKYSLFGFGF